MCKTIAPISTSIRWFLAVVALMQSAVSAGETIKNDKCVVVCEILLKGFTRAQTRREVSKPIRITNAEELAKAFPDSDEEWLARIARKVDFEKDKLLFFAWNVFATDRLSYKIEKTKKRSGRVFPL